MVIDIPTYHIFGCDDAFLSSAVALFNVCQQDNAMMYDHGLGHIVPRDVENVSLLGKFLEGFMPKVEEANRAAQAAEKERGRRPVIVRTGSETDTTGSMDDDLDLDAGRERMRGRLSRVGSRRGGRARGVSDGEFFV